MLCNVNFVQNPIANIIALVGGRSQEVMRLEDGVYQIGHFSFDLMIDPLNNMSMEAKWPDLGEFSSTGVCDNYKQVLDQCPELANPERRFVMSVTPIEKKDEPPSGGWRWRKWGPYIGDHTPTCEYLYDEPEIDIVYCYHIYEMI